MPWTIEFWLKTLQEPANFWAMITAVTTGALVAVAYYQLKDLAKTNKSEFLYKLKKDFFTEEARCLIFLAENELLEFRSSEIPYFQIVPSDSADTQTLKERHGVTNDLITTGLVDDVLLGPLEDVGILLERNLVSLDEAYEQFDSFVQICAENKAIGEYLDLSRALEDDDDVYDHFQKLYEKLKTRGPEIRAKKRKDRRGSRVPREG
jgi:hypothetical protein